MKLFITSVFFLVSFAGSASAAGQVTAPGPEMTAGLIGMTLAAGAIYLIKRRKRS